MQLGATRSLRPARLLCPCRRSAGTSIPTHRRRFPSRRTALPAYNSSLSPQAATARASPSPCSSEATDMDRRFSGERGASLLLALGFLLAFSLAIPALLRLGATNFLATTRLRDQRAEVYVAD